MTDKYPPYVKKEQFSNSDWVLAYFPTNHVRKLKITLVLIFSLSIIFIIILLIFLYNK